MSTATVVAAAKAGDSRSWPIAVGYVLVFLLLDWISFIRPLEGFNITPWNPHPALAVALLLWRRNWLGVVWLGLAVAELAVRGLPQDWLAAATATAALTLCYAAIARGIDRITDGSPVLASRRALLRLTAICIAGAGIGGGLYVGTYALLGSGPSTSPAEAMVRFWIGDAVGLVVMLPMLLVLMDPKRRLSLGATLRSGQWWLVATLIVVLLWFVFGREDRNHFKFFYLLMLPVMWASASQGLAGAVLAAATTQVGLIIAVQTVPNPDLTVFELQVLLAALTMTGLALGVTVDERARAQAELRSTLRMAAAGQMTAALAHELSQPLTALASYAQAARLLAAAVDIDEADRSRRLVDVSQRMGEDARRAAEVVKRLRDFFRTGSTQLQCARPVDLLRKAAESQARRAESIGAGIDIDADDTLPMVLVDSVQIGVVLRNLIANALDAATDASSSIRVTLRARTSEDILRVEVQDNGPGIDGARLRNLFDTVVSDKPGGMGIGLGICRAIVEAHGGQIWVEPGPGGKVCFALPLDSRQPISPEARHES